MQHALSLTSKVSELDLWPQYKLRKPWQQSQYFAHPQRQPVITPQLPLSSFTSRDTSSDVVRSQTLIRVYVIRKSSYDIQKAPSSASTNPSSFFTCGCAFHSGLLSDQAPFHSKVPQGLRSCMRRSFFALWAISVLTLTPPTLNFLVFVTSRT